MNRPKTTQSETHKILTSCGSLYITVGIVEQKPIEVFITMGKSGACETCQNAALGIAISMALQNGVDISVFADSLRGIQCPKPRMFPKNERVLSCPDAVAGILVMYKRDDKYDE